MTSYEPHEWKYVDPRKDDHARKGMLLSDEIDMFSQKKLLISDNYDLRCLRPAAYTLRIGDEYVDSMGNFRKLSEKCPHFKIPPNSIVYVSTYEKLDLPHYIAARFNLRVNWVYKGILLGTGPQVEPGYRGYLSCPLYNLTNQPIRIERLKEFASIDFERTADFCRGMTADSIKKSKAYWSDKLEYIECEGARYLLFRQDEYPALKLYPDHDVTSSLTEMHNEVKTWRQIGIGLIVAFFALTLALLSFGNNIYTQLSARSKDSIQIEQRLRDTEIEVDRLQKQVSQVEGKLAATQTGAPKTGDPALQSAGVERRP